MISRIRGTRDILNTDKLSVLLLIIEQHLEQYHYTHIILPTIEPLDLFNRALGQNTDVVSKEMFLVSSLSPSKERICLRPEATASTVRAFIENSIQDLPWKVFSYGSMFRYERPQKGRFREFYQCSMEVIGSKSLSEDVRLISIIDALFAEKLQLNEYALHMNYLGCSDDRTIFKKHLYNFLETVSADICKTCTVRKDANILRIFDCKNDTCQDAYKNAPHLVQSLCETCDHEWNEIQNRLEELSVSFVYNPYLVRGLDYYNKTIFEFVSPLLGAQSAFCGGGRYDSLVSMLGGKQDQPAIGAAIGVDRLLLLLEAVESSVLMSQKDPLYVVMPLAEEQHPVALKVAQKLQKAKIVVDVLFEGSVKSMMRKANKMGARSVIIIGSDEQENNSVMIKNMMTGESETVKQLDILDTLK